MLRIRKSNEQKRKKERKIEKWKIFFSLFLRDESNRNFYVGTNQIQFYPLKVGTPSRTSVIINVELNKSNKCQQIITLRVMISQFTRFFLLHYQRIYFILSFFFFFRLFNVIYFIICLLNIIYVPKLFINIYNIYVKSTK